MFLPNKIIKNNKLNYPQKNVGLAHGIKTMKPCAMPSKQPMVLLYMVQEGLANGFKTMCKALHMVLKPWGNVVMFVSNKIKNNNKYYMSAINNIK